MEKNLFVLRDNEIAGRCIQYIMTKPMNGEFCVEIKKNKTTRSIQQNRLYWSWVNILADHFGYTPEEMHLELGTAFLPLREYKTRKNKTLVMPVSTTSLSTKEFTEYLEKIDKLAQQQNVKIPRPEELGYEM